MACTFTFLGIHFVSRRNLLISSINMVLNTMIIISGNEMEKTAAQVLYKSGESYGKGLFCLFGAT